MEVPGFTIPCNPPLLPATIDLIPNGLVVSQGLATIRLDGAGVDGLLQVAGLVALLRLSQQPVGPMTAVPIREVN